MLRTAIAPLLFIPICAFSAGPPTQLQKGVAALVNGEPILELTVKRALERVPADRRAAARMQVIDYLADNLLIDQKLRAIPACKVEKAEVDKKVNDMKADVKKIGQDFNKMLDRLNVTEAELRQHIAADLRWFKYFTAKITGKVLRETFAREKELFDGTKVRARHILIAPKVGTEAALAEATRKAGEIKTTIEAEVEAGMAKLPGDPPMDARERLLQEVFARHAKKESGCPTKEKGGDLGWFPKAGLMVADFADAAFALKVNQMSGPVRTQFGTHLILVTERKPGKAVEFDAVKDAVKEVFLERLRDEFTADLRKKATILIRPAD